MGLILKKSTKREHAQSVKGIFFFFFFFFFFNLNLSGHFFGHSFRFQPGQGVFRGCFLNTRNIFVTKICTKTYVVLFVPLPSPSPHLYQNLLCNICTQTYFEVAIEQLRKEKSAYLKFFVFKNNSKVNQIVESIFF